MDRGIGEALEMARAGGLEALEALLADEPELVTARGPNGTTLLHVAAEVDGLPTAELLVSRKAPLEAEASWGYTPFEWAAAMASDRVAAYLLGLGARRLNLWTAAALGMLDYVESCFTEAGLTPGTGRSPRPGADLSGWPEDTPYRSGDELSDAFHIAARNGRTKVADYLLRRGADVDATGYFGATALHWAAVAGREPIVRWLVEAGADPDREDSRFGSRPSGWADEGSHASLARFLRSKESS